MLRMVYFCFVLLLLSQQQFSQVKFPANLDTAYRYLNLTELTGKNDGFHVEKFLKSVGRKKGDSWCAAAVSYWNEVSGVVYPKIKSGIAQAFITKLSVDSKDVVMGIYKISPGDICIWRNGETWTGHVGLVKSWKGSKGITIEGNTSPTTKGSQSNGGGCYEKQRSIIASNYFRIIKFTKTTYKAFPNSISKMVLYNGNR